MKCQISAEAYDIWIGSMTQVKLFRTACKANQQHFGMLNVNSLFRMQQGFRSVHGKPQIIHMLQYGIFHILLFPKTSTGGPHVMVSF